MVDAIPPMEDLDSIFTLPDDVPPEYREMYEVLIARLRREVEHLSVTTIQVLLIERIARNYIVLRIKENAGAMEGGFAHATAQKEFNTFWLSMTQEFNRQVRSQDVGSYERIMHEFVGIMTSTLDDVLAGHPDLAKAARDRLADALDERGI